MTLLKRVFLIQALVKWNAVIAIYIGSCGDLGKASCRYTKQEVCLFCKKRFFWKYSSSVSSSWWGYSIAFEMAQFLIILLSDWKYLKVIELNCYWVIELSWKLFIWGIYSLIKIKQFLLFIIYRRSRQPFLYRGYRKLEI